MSKARELAELSRTVADSADAVAITINSNEEVTFADDILLADGKKAIFGAGSDLQIYSDGTTGKLVGNVDVTGTVTADGLTVDATAGTVASLTSGSTTTHLDLNNTHANGWGSNIAFQTGGTAAGYFGSIGSLLGNTDQDLTAYSTAGNGFRIYTNGNNERLRVTSAGNVGIGTDSPDKTLHVVGSDGVTTFSGYGSRDFLVLENNQNCNFQIISNSSNAGNILFSDEGASGRGILKYNHASDFMSFTTAAAEAMRIDASGKVGIGTDSPTAALHAKNAIDIDTNAASGTGVFRLQGGVSTYSGYIGFDASTMSIGTNNASRGLSFAAGGSEAMRIDANRRVGIGTDNPAAAKFSSTPDGVLNLSGDKPVVYLTEEDETDSNVWMGLSNEVGIIGNTGVALAFRTGASTATERMRIDASGRVGIGTTPSSNWANNFVLQIGTKGSFANSSAFTGMSTNIVATSSGWATKYLADGAGSAYLQAVSDGNHRFYTAPSGSAGATATLTEAMRIDASGNVGINGASGGATLQVNQATASYIDIKSDNALRMRMYGDSNQAILVSEGVPLIFKYGSTEAMRIANTGQVLVGSSTSPASGEVKQTLVRGGSSYLEFQNTSTNTGSTIGTSGENLIVYTNSGALGSEVYTERMRIDASGSVGIGTTTMNGGLNLGNFRGTASAPSFSGTNGDGFVFDYYNDTNPYGRHGSIAVIGAGTATADMSFWTDSGSAVTEAMRIDANGSVGIGVVPLAHHYKSLEIGNAGSQITGRTPADTYFMSGLYWSSNSTIKYAVSSVPVGYYSITNGVHSWHNSAAGTAGNDATINTAMTLDASGFLNVGATGTAGTVVFNRSSDGNGAGAISVVGDDFVLNTGFASANMIFKNVTSESMRLDTSGNLLVGVTSISDATSRTYGNAFSGTSANPNWKSWGSGTHTNAQFRNATNVVGTIVTTSTTTTYNTSSDQRLKENIADAPSASDDIDAIQVRSFDWKADGSHQKYGMVAQELQVVAPEAVAAPEDPEEMMGVDYSKLVPMLIKEIQSLRARVAQLES